VTDAELEQQEDVTANTKTLMGEALGVNNKEQVVGWFSGYRQNCAFLWQNNRYTILEGVRLPTMPRLFEREDSYETEAVDINDNGVIAGHIDHHPVRWQGGKHSYLRGLKGERRVKGGVICINKDDVILGSVGDGTNKIPVLWQGNECIALHRFLSAKEQSETQLVRAWDMNDSGRVVGEANHRGKKVGFVLDTQ
jgi:uncharacterized membrane protein